MEELKFGGEWILSEDETLVADGHEQRYLYMVVMGEVGIFKANDNGKQQHIATPQKGAAFGDGISQRWCSISKCAIYW